MKLSKLFSFLSLNIIKILIKYLAFRLSFNDISFLYR